jgi:hypothetical protein
LAKSSVNNSKRTGKRLFRKGQSGNPNGRPKGSKDKFTELKDAFLSAFDELGGVKGLVKWAKRSNDNTGHFYQMITKLLPRDINLDTPGDLILQISKSYKPKVKRGKRE